MFSCIVSETGKARRKRFSYDFNTIDDDTSLSLLSNTNNIHGYNLVSNTPLNLYNRQHVYHLKRHPRHRYRKFFGSRAYIPAYNSLNKYDLRSLQLQPRSYYSRRQDNVAAGYRNGIAQQRSNLIGSHEAKLADEIQNSGDFRELAEQMQSYTPDLSYYQNNERRGKIFEDILTQQNRDIHAIANLMPPGTSMSYDGGRALTGRNMQEMHTPPESTITPAESTEMAGNRQSIPYDTELQMERTEEPQFNSDVASRNYLPSEANDDTAYQRNDEAPFQKNDDALSQRSDEAPSTQNNEMSSQQNVETSQHLQEVIDQQTKAINDLYEMIQHQKQEPQSHVEDSQLAYYGLPEQEQQRLGPYERPYTSEISHDEQVERNMESERPDYVNHLQSQLLNSMRSRFQNENPISDEQNAVSENDVANYQKEEEESEMMRQKESFPNQQELSNKELLLRMISMLNMRQNPPTLASQNFLQVPKQQYSPLFQPTGSAPGLPNIPSTSGGENRSLLPLMKSPSSLDSILASLLKTQQTSSPSSQQDFFRNFPQPASLDQSSYLQNRQGVAMLMVQSVPDNNAVGKDGALTEKKEKVEHNGKFVTSQLSLFIAPLTRRENQQNFLYTSTIMNNS